MQRSRLLPKGWLASLVARTRVQQRRAVSMMPAPIGRSVFHYGRRNPGPPLACRGATGEVSGFHVLDIDTRKNGETWFAQHRRRLPVTRAHQTRSGGLHLFFRHQQGLRCSAGKIAPGVDVRASAGYILWCPAAGLPVLRNAPMAPWPEWLCALLSSPPRSTTSRVVVAD